MKDEAPIPLPAEYLQLLAISNGGEGDLGAEPGWVDFWPAEMVLELNRSYGLCEAAPDFFGFGSSGGGELLALDAREGPLYPVVAIPFIPIDPSLAVKVAGDFGSLLQLVGTPAPAA